MQFSTKSELQFIFSRSPATAKYTYADILKHVDTADKVTIDETFRAALKNKTAWNVEFTMQHDNEKPQDILLHAEPAQVNRNGDKIMKGVVRDITFEKKIQLAARRQDQQRKILLHTSHDIIWAVDAVGRILFIPDDIQNKLGYNRDELLGKIIYQFMPDANIWRVKKRLSSAFRKMSKQIKLRTSFIHKAGAHFTFNTNLYISYDADGKPEQIHGSSKNISGILRKRKELHSTEKQLLALFENHPLPMWIYDGRLNFKAVNKKAAELYGYTKKEFLQMCLPDLFSRAERMKLHKKTLPNREFSRDIAEGRLLPYYIEYMQHHVKKNGETLYVIVAEEHDYRYMSEKLFWELYMMFPADFHIKVAGRLQIIIRKVMPVMSMALYTLMQKAILCHGIKGHKVCSGGGRKKF